MVQRMMQGGDLLYHMELRKRSKREFSEDEARFIIACIILALEYLHNNGIIHRDIKPENILISARGICKLTDFQLARIWREENFSDTSGSPGYCAPEVLKRQNHGPCVDWFAVGAVTYEMMLGKRPWEGDDRNTYRDNLLADDVILKKADTPESWNHEASDFINKCLLRDPAFRLGVNGTNEIKAHVWFKEFDWLSLIQQKLQAPLIPLAFVNYYDDKKLFRERLKQLEYNANKAVEIINEDLLQNFEFQKLFENYYYNLDEQRIRDVIDMEAARKN